MKHSNDSTTAVRYEKPVLVNEGDFRTVTAGFLNIVKEPVFGRFA